MSTSVTILVDVRKDEGLKKTTALNDALEALYPEIKGVQHFWSPPGAHAHAVWMFGLEDEAVVNAYNHLDEVVEDSGLVGRLWVSSERLHIDTRYGEEG